MSLARAFLGLFVFSLSAFFLSSAKKEISWTKILRLFTVQCLLAFFLLKTSAASLGFAHLQRVVDILSQAVQQGTSFVFGYIGGGPAPFESQSPENLFIFMFQALPMIVLISALSMLAFHWKILPFLMRHISGGVRRIFGIGSALATCMAAKLFFGQTDAPLVIRPYLPDLTRNEVFSIMTAGMATASMTLFALYAMLLGKTSLGSEALGHVFSATLLNIFSALILAELAVPSGGQKTSGQLESPYQFSGASEALSAGAVEGWSLIWVIAPLLIVSLAVVFLLEKMFSGCTGLILQTPLSLQTVFGYLCMPLTWLMGIPTAEIHAAGSVLSMKVLLNEVVALLFLSKEAAATGKILSASSLVVMTYPLCSFANISSIAIQMGGFSKLMPQCNDLSSLVYKALFMGVLAGCFSGAVVCIINF